MFREPENGYFALALTCLFCLAAFGAVSIGFSFYKGYQSADKEHSIYYAERDQAEKKFRECLNTSMDLDSARDCTDDVPKLTRETERSEQNLIAQREMARWAEAVLLATWTIGLLSFFATLIGIRYIHLNLVATRKMIEQTEYFAKKQVRAAKGAILETRRIGEAQVKCYLSLNEIQVRKSHGMMGVEIGFRLQNSGQSPARGVEMFVFIEMNLSSVDMISGKYIGPFRKQTKNTRIDISDIASGKVFHQPVFGTSDLLFDQGESDLGPDLENVISANIFLIVAAVDIFDEEVTIYAHGSVRREDLISGENTFIDIFDQQSEPLYFGTIDDLNLAGSKYQSRLGLRGSGQQ